MSEKSKRREPTDPQEWLRRARSNLARAKADRSIPEVVLEDLCFDAQQAVEKAIKAILVFLQQSYPKTHSIVELFDIVQEHNIEIPSEIREAEELTVFAVSARYPGLDEDVTEDEYRRAIKQAKRVVHWAQDTVRQGESPENRKGNMSTSDSNG